MALKSEILLGLLLECWELNLGPLQDQQVLLITEISLALSDSFLLTVLAPGMDEWVDSQIRI